jgi:tetratricopeptide (TPR) repeat protein
VAGHLDAYVHEVLSYGQEFQYALHAVRVDPACVLANVFAADFFMAKADMERSRLYLGVAQKQAALQEITPRERLYVGAYAAWLDGDHALAFVSFKEILVDCPQDLYAAKRGSLVAFLFDPPKMLDILTEQHVAQALERRPYYLANVSFALEQNNQPKQAAEVAFRALEITPDDPWSHHAVAHALHALGDWERGLDFMLSKQNDWERSMNFMYTHNWFHVSLFYMDKLALKEVLAVFDEHLWLECEAEPDAPADGKRAEAPLEIAMPEGFPRNNKDDPMDQMSAFLLLWLYELHRNASSALVLPAPAPRPSQVSRWASVVDYVRLPTGNMNALYDLLVLQGLLTQCESKQSESKAVARHVTSISGSYGGVVARIADCMVAMQDGEWESALSIGLEVFCPLCEGQGGGGGESNNEGEFRLTVTGKERRLSLQAPSQVGGSVEQRSVLIEFFISVLMANALPLDSKSSSASSIAAYVVLRALLQGQTNARGCVTAKHSVCALVAAENYM